jgi:hypothetical protein
VRTDEPRRFSEARTGSRHGPTSLPFDPFRLGPHGEALLERRVMLAPVLVEWRYRIADAAAFRGWLATKEILLSEARMSKNDRLAAVRYGGTYRVASDLAAPGGAYRTLWGYASEAAMARMHELGSGAAASATLIELEMVDFVTGLKRFVAAAGDQHFAQEVLVAAEAAG